MFEKNKPITRKRRWFRLSLILLLVISLFALAFSHGLRYGTVRWLESRGADSVRIGWLHLNPLTGFVRVEDIVVRKGGEVVLRGQDIDIDIGIRDLFRHKLAVEKAGLDGVHLDLRQYEDGRIQLGPVIIGNESEGQEDSSGDSWIVSIAGLRLSNCQLSLTSPVDTFLLRAEDLDLRHFSTAGSREKDTSVSFRGSLNTAPLHLEVRNSQIMPRPAVSGRIDVDNLDLTGFSGLTGDILNQLAGRFSAGGEFVLNLSRDNRLNASYDGDLALRSIKLGSQNQDLSSDELVWQGSLNYKGLASHSSLILDGDLNASVSALKVSKPELEVEQESLHLTTRSALSFTGGPPELSSNNTLEMNGTELRQKEDRKFKAEVLAWRGKTAYRSSDQPELSLNGAFRGKGFAGGLQDRELGLNLDGWLLSTDTAILTGKDVFEVSSANNLKVSGIGLELGEEELVRGRVEKLHLEKCRLNSLDDINTGLLEFDDLSLILKEPEGQSLQNKPVLSISKGTAENIFFLKGESISVGKVDLVDFFSQIRRERDGGLYAGRILNSLSKEKAKEEKTGKTDFKLDRLKVGGESRLLFDDYSTLEPFHAVLDIKAIKMTDLNSAEPGEPFSFEVQGNLAEYSKLEVNGTCSPFAGKSNLTLDTRLQDYPVPNLSPYAVDLIGYHLSRGHVDLDSHLKIRGNNLESSNNFLFEKLEVRPASKEEAEKMTTLLGNISLDQALSLLRDSENHINLDLPVSGPLDDLQVGFDNIVKKAVSKAVITGTKTYFLAALGPYGALISVGMKVGEELLKVRLPPVAFAPGETDLQQEQRNYLEKLAEVLYERPELKVTLVGTAVMSERELIPVGISEKNGADRPLTGEERQYLLKQAGRRAAAVRKYMVEEYGMDSGRIFLSDPLLDKDEEAEPRVELGF